MNSVERVFALCKERGIAISKLERDLGFANAYFRGLKEGKMPANRLQMVADYFGVSMEYLLTGEEPEGYYINPETAEVAQAIYEDKDLRLLFDVVRDVTPEQLRLLHDLALSWKKG